MMDKLLNEVCEGEKKVYLTLKFQIHLIMKLHTLCYFTAGKILFKKFMSKNHCNSWICLLWKIFIIIQGKKSRVLQEEKV